MQETSSKTAASAKMIEPFDGQKLPVGSSFLVGKYTVVVDRYLSEGGFSQVYLVGTRSKTDGTPFVCVMKRMYAQDEASLENVHTEIETMKLLRGNPHIVNYIDSCIFPTATESQPNGCEILLLMEYCAGGGLIDLMNQRLQTRLSQAEVLKIMSDVVQGVAALHYLRPPLIHRDLKIENVLISSPTCYKLCDFGSVCAPIRMSSNPAERHRIKADIEKYTTYQYRAPEMIDMSHNFAIDEKSDIWALGVLFYKLCYYTTPFENQGPAAMVTATYVFPPFPPYSGYIKRLISTMLHKNPCCRPNIFQVQQEICMLRGTQLPFRDMYKGVNSSYLNPPALPETAGIPVKPMYKTQHSIPAPISVHPHSMGQQIPVSHFPSRAASAAPSTNQQHTSSNPFLAHSYVSTPAVSGAQKPHKSGRAHPELQPSSQLSPTSQAYSSSSPNSLHGINNASYLNIPQNPFPVSTTVTGASVRSSAYFEASNSVTGNGHASPGLEDVEQRYPDIGEIEANVLSRVATSAYQENDSARNDEIAKLADDTFAAFLQKADNEQGEEPQISPVQTSATTASTPNLVAENDKAVPSSLTSEDLSGRSNVEDYVQQSFSQLSRASSVRHSTKYSEFSKKVQQAPNMVDSQLHDYTSHAGLSRQASVPSSHERSASVTRRQSSKNPYIKPFNYQKPGRHSEEFYRTTEPLTVGSFAESLHGAEIFNAMSEKKPTESEVELPLHRSGTNHSTVESIASVVSATSTASHRRSSHGSAMHEPFYASDMSNEMLSVTEAELEKQAQFKHSGVKSGKSPAHEPTQARSSVEDLVEMGIPLDAQYASSVAEAKVTQNKDT
ncbi:NAK protein kinase Ppk29 [Schizosaccharomyces japonicus yFS275]|uniref:NAK protein kinase Ppk29 n=1 Tax=Schizosaccharomyces japonicus (strain yFS275 / FY16936) TaxID=402676 RepID=B6K6W5_SCHJY|nr:NAK protein kinase Ppk29 [Schizosaccharomyces japonicus yFS275]EEB09269.1 NAK protein kinase Ppk29 [Schizosaccharomyces japonicus yFS275]